MRKKFYNILIIFKMLAIVIFYKPILIHAEEWSAGADNHAQYEPNKKMEENWNLHGQFTIVTQGHPPFPAEYSGANSLSMGAEAAASFTATVYLGKRVWKNGEIYATPEVLAGNGLSSTLGLAGAPNGEIYRVDSPEPKFNLSRIFLKQSFSLGGTKEYKTSDLNQLAGFYDSKRFSVIIGKFSLVDFFDNNDYSDDPRTQFLNWSLMYNGAWDFSADTRGYTWGFILELEEPAWALRFGTVMVPKEANQMDLDNHLSKAHGDNIEFEYRYSLNERPGTARIMSYFNHAHMGNYRETISNPNFGMDITQSRQYRVKYGLGLNLEQEITSYLGASLRLGWNDGMTETWAFTEIDRTAALTVSLKGMKWNRPVDNVGVGIVINGLSGDHADYLSSGGYGFIIGDGKLNYAPEEIVETFYLWKPVAQMGISPDFQFVNHPAYNAARGPVFIMGLRIHVEY